VSSICARCCVGVLTGYVQYHRGGPTAGACPPRSPTRSHRGSRVQRALCCLPSPSIRVPCLIGWARGRQSINAYDLRPFFAAVAGLARLDGLLPADDAAPATPATPDNDSCNGGPCD